jgi:integrase
MGAGRAPATVNRRLALLSAALTYARELDWEVKLTKVRRVRGQESRLGFLTREQVAQIVELLDTWGQPDMARYTLVLAYTGMRPSEGLAMVMRDVADDGASVLIPNSKSGKSRTLPLGVTPRGALAEQIDARRESGVTKMSDKVFGFKYAAFRVWWDRAREALGKADDDQFVPYILRHTFASWLVQRGTQIQVVSELMGHADLTMTLRYAKLTPTHLSDAVQDL